MKKIHTRAKRKFCLTTSLRHYFYFHPKINKVRGARTFKSEESANKWAKENGIADYTLKKIKCNKKFQIVAKTE